MFLRSIKRIRFVQIQLFLVITIGLILGVATVIEGPSSVFVGIIAFLLIYIVFRKPEIAILGSLVLTSSFLGFESNPGFSIGFGTIYLTDILIILILLVIVVRLFIEPGFTINHTPLDVPILLFVGFSLLSTFIAIIQGSLPFLLTLHEMRIVAYYLVFFGVTNLVRTDDQIRYMIRGLIILAAIVAAITMIQYSLGESIQIIPGRVSTLRTEGVTFESVTRIIPPGESSMFVVFVALSVVVTLGRSRTSNQILLIPWVLTGLGVILIFKRHLWIPAILAFLIIVYLGSAREMARLFRGGLIILFIMLVSLIILYNFTGEVGPQFIDSSIDRLISLFREETYMVPSTLRWRDFEYKYAFEKFISHPFFGIGLGAKYRPYIVGKDWEEYDGRTYIHNGNMWVLSKGGLLSYLPLLWVIVSSISRGFKYWSMNQGGWKRYYVLGFTLAIFGMFIGSNISPLWMKLAWTTLIGFVLGINELLLQKAT
jgi:hypothetical protein